MNKSLKPSPVVEGEKEKKLTKKQQELLDLCRTNYFSYVRSLNEYEESGGFSHYPKHEDKMVEILTGHQFRTAGSLQEKGLIEIHHNDLNQHFAIYKEQ